MQISDEIKSKLDVVDVIREYLNLKPVGSNFSALSPFNREKTPSFMVSPEKQIWHCFSSGKGGDVITFVMEMEGVSFVEALRILAPKAGVTLRKQDPKTESKRNKLLDIMQIAVNFYHNNLLESKSALPARQYLAKRGLSQETLIDWQIGFSLDSWEDLVSFLRSRGYQDEDIIAAGLANRRDKSPGSYNRFRDRIMFPINDFYGNPIAFSARVRPDKEDQEVLGKYINSPQTFLYDKSKVVFGLDKAKNEIRNSNKVVVVEGQMDVITAHQAGFKNVVASSGTALTQEQLKLIKRYSTNIIFAFDMDQAGQTAVDRAIREAFPLEINVKVITLPTGKDPDDFIKNDPDGWQREVSQAKHVMDYYFDKTFQAINTTDIDGKKEVVKKILPIIALIKDRIEKDFWLKKLSEKLHVREDALRETLRLNSQKEKNYSQTKQGQTEDSSQVSNKQNQENKSREERLSEELLTLTLKFPHFLEYLISRLDLEYIAGLETRAFYKNLILYYNKTISTNQEIALNYTSLKEFFNRELDDNNNFLENQLKLLDKLVILGDKDYSDLEEIGAKNQIIKILIELKKAYIIKRMKEIEITISEAEQEGEKEKSKDLMMELNKLSQELNELK